MHKLSFFLLSFLFALNSIGQFKQDTTDLTLTGTKVNPYDVDYDTTGKVTFSGYIDTYYSYYSDTVDANGYSKFPSSAPRTNQFGLNIAQFSVKYESTRLRGIATVFFGDSPKSVWEPTFNYIQEANLGFRIYKKLWLDAGLFRTHIGMESIQPRENITTSLAAVSFFETYFVSGAKLTWQQSNKWLFQVNAFNGYSSFIEDNDSKAFGFSIVHNSNKRWSHTLNFIICDESPSGSKQQHVRQYTNYLSIFKGRKVTFGLEANFGTQQNSGMQDSTKTAFIYSGIAAFKYRFTDKIGAYTRAELFSDANAVLIGPMLNHKNELTGLNIIGGTFGVEYKPIPNAYLRIESRLIRTKRNELIFYQNTTSRNYRWEGIMSLGVWF